MKIYQVDAFTNTLYGGNPAAVCPLNEFLSDKSMQNIALENNLSETAFIVPNESGYDIRWFTPALEVDLCGHATLAAAHVLFKHLGFTESVIHFHSPRSGALSVTKKGDWYCMDFPKDDLEAISPIPDLNRALQVNPIATFKGKTDIMLLIDNQSQLEALEPDFNLLGTIPDIRGTIVTSRGDVADFVSRCFFPQVGINEDPATGSAHTTLTPYWANRLNKTKMSAQQLSARCGTLNVELHADRVLISGQAVTYMIGELYQAVSK